MGAFSVIGGAGIIGAGGVLFASSTAGSSILPFLGKLQYWSHLGWSSAVVFRNLWTWTWSGSWNNPWDLLPSLLRCSHRTMLPTSSRAQGKAYLSKIMLIVNSVSDPWNQLKCRICTVYYVLFSVHMYQLAGRLVSVCPFIFFPHLLEEGANPNMWGGWSISGCFLRKAFDLMKSLLFTNCIFLINYISINLTSPLKRLFETIFIKITFWLNGILLLAAKVINWNVLERY